MEADTDNPDALTLDRVPFYGRTLDEYCRVFGLDPLALSGKRVLDAPAGAASFTAEARRLGAVTVACDPMFGEPAARLLRQGRKDIAHVIEAVEKVPHLYDWDYYGSLAGLEKARRKALAKFNDDYEVGLRSGHYVKAALPKLPFAGRAFDIVLSGHFLFTHTAAMDYEFHLHSLLELRRVALQEARIYPLAGMDGAPYPHMDRLLADLTARGLRPTLIETDWEFQKGAGKLLRIM